MAVAQRRFVRPYTHLNFMKTLFTAPVWWTLALTLPILAAPVAVYGIWLAVVVASWLVARFSMGLVVRVVCGGAMPTGRANTHSSERP